MISLIQAWVERENGYIYMDFLFLAEESWLWCGMKSKLSPFSLNKFWRFPEKAREPREKRRVISKLLQIWIKENEQIWGGVKVSGTR